MVCYVINGWGFNGLSDTVGYPLGGLQKLSRVTTPTDTIYITDSAVRRGPGTSPWKTGETLAVRRQNQPGKVSPTFATGGEWF